MTDDEVTRLITSVAALIAIASLAYWACVTW